MVRNTLHSTWQRTLLTGGMAVVLAGSLAACSGSSGEAAEAGEGVAHGATKEDFVAAFEDVEPIELTAQSALPEGAGTKNFDDYFAALEEWSGGKITVEHAYSNGIVEGADVDVALSDGRLDIAIPLLFNKPQEYPQLRNLNVLSALPDNSVVRGTSSKLGWLNEVGIRDEALIEELDRGGMKMLVAHQASGGPRLFCSSARNDLADLSGAQVAAQGVEHAAAVEALGATPVSMPFTEFYEGLQRGVVDCIFVGANSVVSGGFLEVAPHAVADEAAQVVWNSAPVVISQERWDALPLVAQQLLWDRLDTLLAATLEKTWQTNLEFEAALEEQDGTIEPFAKDALQAVNESGETLLADTATANGDEIVTEAEEASGRWAELVADLGVSEDVPYGEFTEWYSANPIDSEAIGTLIYEEVYLPLRPE
jgi:TRAP-type C4-dicarboxylate transport system substrate-binding protein